MGWRDRSQTIMVQQAVPSEVDQATSQETTYLTDHLRLPIDTAAAEQVGCTVLLGNWPMRLASAAIAVPKIRLLLEPLGRIACVTARSFPEKGLIWWYVTFQNKESVQRSMDTTVEVSKAVEGGLRKALEDLDAELQALDEARLQKEATYVGVDQDRLEQAIEIHNPQARKKEIVELIVNFKRAAMQAEGTGAVTLSLSPAEVNHELSGTREFPPARLPRRSGLARGL
jgi:hypothetical protein